MKRYLSVLLATCFMTLSAFAQTISITTSNTASVCYNDGTLTVNATGGTAPYIDSILSGPTNPNLSYPIGLPSGQNVFTNLPHGTFTIRVHDAAGHNGTFTASVGGTYEFPTDTLYLKSAFNFQTGLDTIICNVRTGTGKSPFKYAISSTGANTGFGPYQNGNHFTHLCNGQYWVRVIDSCGNIFTNTITVNTSVYTYPSCYNIAAGSATLKPIGGVPPYTYTIRDTQGHVVSTNQTGIFSGISLLSSYSITDSCGRTFSGIFNVPNPTYSETCPFDSSVYVNLFTLPPFYPIYITCLNCLPVQTDTIISAQGPTIIRMFHNMNGGQNYYLRMTDACGNVIRDTVRPQATISVSFEFSSCNSIQAIARYPDQSIVPVSQIDSVVLLLGRNHYVSSNGYFSQLRSHLPTYFDTIKVYLRGGCIGISPQWIAIPHLDAQKCTLPAHGPNCDPTWNVSFGNGIHDTPETLYLISSNNDTLSEYPPGAYNGANFYNLTPGSVYTLVSDSGCHKQIQFLSYPSIIDTISSYVTCTGQPIIRCTVNTQYYTNNSSYPIFLVKLYLNGSLAVAPDTGTCNNFLRVDLRGHYKTFNVPDSGTYTYKIYLLGSTIFDNDTNALNSLIRYNINTIYDSICPIDSGSIYVSKSTVPFPFVQTAYKCNSISNGPPMLTIYGGSIPYTVQVAGVDTFIMNTNTTVFPDTLVGTYNIIAYDNCGISRSFTFSIYDSCVCTSPSGVVSAHQLSGLSYQFNDSITGGGSGPFTYTWNFGDSSATANTANPNHTFPVNSNNTPYTITVIVNNPCGSDTQTVVVHATNGIDNMVLEKRVSVYPNPTQGNFTITIDGNTAATLSAQLCDIAGRSIYKQSIHTGDNKFDLMLAPGVYLIKISDGDAQTTKMLTVK